MPRVPKWMANAMEKLFRGSYHPVEVTKIKKIADKLNLVRFEGDFSKIKKDFIPGNIIEFRVSDTEFRHYTPSFFNKNKGVCEVMFYLHEKGPGSKWVSKLKIKDTLNLLGPGGKIKFEKNSSFHIFFGDETSLGFMKCMSQEAKLHKQKYLCIVELDENHFYWTQLIDLKSVKLKKSKPNKAQSASDYLKKWIEENQENIEEVSFYLTGNAHSIKNIRNTLKMSNIQMNRVKSEPYWVEGKSGL